MTFKKYHMNKLYLSGVIWLVINQWMVDIPTANGELLQGGVQEQSDTQQYCQTIQNENGNADNPLQMSARQLNAAANQGNPGALIGGLTRLALHQGHKRLSGQTDSRLSCVGLQHNAITGVVIYVDPMSDVYQSVRLGDVLLSEDDMQPMQYERRRLNYGQENTIVKLHIRHRNDSQEYIMCRRQPLHNFSLMFQAAVLPL